MRALLAQRLTEFPFASWCKANDLHPRDVAIVQSCVENLQRPCEGNHIILPHRALGPVYAADAEQHSVAIYHFDRNAMDAARAIGDSNRRRKLVLDSARTPAPRCFLEWQNHEPSLEHLTHGIYTEGDRDELRFVRWCDCIDDDPHYRPRPLMWGKISLDTGKGYVEIPSGEYSYEREKIIGKLQREARFQLAFMWALLASTGATVIAQTPAPRGSGKDRRMRSPGSAILSFNRVRLAVPKGLIARTDTVKWERGSGVRRHQVRGHPSFYWTGPRENRNLVTRWIAAYWRGNARLGLVLKVSDVESKL